MRESRLSGLLRNLWLLPVRHPAGVVLLVLFSIYPAVRASLRLPVESGLGDLLPESSESVIELRRETHRLAGASTLIVVAEGKDEASLRRFVDLVAPRIRELGPRYVVGVDDGNRATRQFVEAHRYLYADRADLEALRDEVQARYDAAVGKRAGFDLGLEDENEAPKREALGDALRSRFGDKWKQATEKIGPDYYITENGHLGAIVVRTPFAAGDARAFQLEKRIEDIVAAVSPRTWDPGLKTYFTGNLVTSAEEHRAITTDLARVGTAGVVVILALVFLFFIRLRVVLSLALTIGTGCFWSFGFAYLSVGYLNSATGFLVSIIAGNGINFGIVLSARYLEARLRDQLPAREAIATAMRESAPGTLTAAACACVAYGSLAATDFRGFRHFGVIGGVGMLLTWLASYTFLPALLALSERLFPIRDDWQSWPNRFRGKFAYPFLFLARRYHREVLTAGAVAGLVATALCVRYVARDPLEYDMTHIRNAATDPTSARALAQRIAPVVDRLNRDGRAILTDRLDQVKPLVDVLSKRRAEAPADRKPFERVISVHDVLPSDQVEKIAIVAEIKDRIERARRLHAISDEEWAKIEPDLPGVLAPLSVDDLPRALVWPFTETDGTRGRVVYLVPTAGQSLNDAHYLMRFADSFREIRLPDGEVIRGTGDPVLFADILNDVRVDGPKALAVSMVSTLLVIVVAFRGRRTGWLALGSMLLGIVWLVASLAAAKIHINFLNFVALPISVGVGADYAVNLMKRYERDGGQHVARGVIETGGALVLCSLTTLFGYAALTLSINGAVRSFGIAGALGELTMLLAAMLILPSILLQRSARTDARRNELPAERPRQRPSDRPPGVLGTGNHTPS